MDVKKKRKRTSSDISGTTLVELIVAFALAAVFMTAAVALIAPFTNVYLRIINMNRIHNISDVVLEKVVDELTFAGTANDQQMVLQNNPGESADHGGQYRRTIQYSDYTGSRVTMNTKDGELLLTYAKTERETEDVKWQFGTDFYQGNKMDLQFQQVAGTKKIKIYLKVYLGKNEDTYSQTTETYVECVDADSGDIITS